jgi:inosine-uridine nucleoside N-ribohydrolase
VAAGAAAPLRRPLTSATLVHGDDGLGGLDRLLDAGGQPRYPVPDIAPEPVEAADLILDVAARFPDRLVIVALGPLTNLALAVERDAGALARVASVVAMGGAIAVPGNVTPAAEFNVYVDPDAADTVLGAGLPVRLVPLDVTHQVVLRRAELEARLAGSRSRHAEFLGDVTRHGFAFGAADGAEGIALHDPLAVAAAIDPSLLGFDRLHVAVEREGRVTRGLTVADLRPIASHRKSVPNCEVAMRVDAARVLALVLGRLCPASG